MKKRTFFAALMLLLSLALLTAACTTETPATSETVVTTPVRGGQIVIGIPRDVDSFNPLFSESVFAQEINHLMLLGLADLDDASEFQAELADRWERSPDHRQLTYYLRKNLTWSDGMPLTAADVKFTFDVLMDPEAASPLRGNAEFVKSVTVIDSFTVRFEFTQSYPYTIFDTAGEILPKHLLADVPRAELRSHSFGSHPISSGPFKLKKWAPQQFIELEANDAYFGGRPYLDGIIFKIIPDQTNLLTQLRTGEVDMVIGVPPAEMQRLQAANANIETYPVSGRRYYYVGYNEAQSRFADARVRQALTMALDRQTMIDALLYGFGRQSVGPIPPMLSWAYNDRLKPFPYDLKKARTLLQEAGWSDSDGDGWIDREGANFEFTLKTDAANLVKSDLAVVIQEQWKKLGIHVDIQLVEWTTYLDQLRARDFDAHLGGWSSSLYIDPTPVFHSSAVDLFNYGGYSNPKVDALIEAGRDEIDREKAAHIWKEFQEVVYEDQHYTFLFWIDRIIAVNDRFGNVTPIPLSALYNIEKWYDKSRSGDLATH